MLKAQLLSSATGNAIFPDRCFLDRIATHRLAFEGASHVESFEGKKGRPGADADPPDGDPYRRRVDP